MKKKFGIILSAVFTAAALAGCSPTPDSSADTKASSESDQEAITNDTAFIPEPVAVNPDNIYADIAFGDIDSFNTLIKSIINLEIDGQTVRIDGVLKKHQDTYSIAEYSGENISSSFNLAITDNSVEMPADDSRVIILGVVTTGANKYTRVIAVSSENIHPADVVYEEPIVTPDTSLATDPNETPDVSFAETENEEHENEFNATEEGE